MKIKVIFIFFLHLQAQLFATSIGKDIEPIKELVVKVSLHVVDVDIDCNNTIRGVRLAWVPLEVSDKCMSLSIEQCANIIHNLRFSSNKNNQMSFQYNDKVITEVLHVDIENIKSKNQLLKFKKTQIARRFIVNQNIHRNSKINYEHPMFTIDNDKIIPAEIKWTLWPNGSSFEIINFL